MGSLTDTGLVVERLAELRTIMQQAYQDDPAVTATIDFENDLVVGILIDILADRLDSTGQLVQAVYDAFDENGASGLQLTNLLRIVGLSRTAATKGTAPAQLTGTAGTGIGAGLVVEGGGTDGRARWVTTTDATIAAGGTVDVTVTAQDAGAIPALATDPVSIVTPIPGLDSAAFTASASQGAADETDDAARARRAVSTQAAGSHTVGALLADVLAVAGVQYGLVIDNPDNVAATVQGVLLPAHSYLVVVLPNPVPAQTSTELLQAIYDNVHIGVRTAATDVTQVITDTNGTGAQLTVGFDYGTELTATIVGTFTLAAGTTSADVVATLSESVNAHIATLQLGDALRHLTLCQLAAAVPGVLAATFTINGSAADLEANANQRVASFTLAAA